MKEDDKKCPVVMLFLIKIIVKHFCNSFLPNTNVKLRRFYLFFYIVVTISIAVQIFDGL